MAHRLRSLSLALFAASLAGGVIAAFVLVLGLRAMGGGHGDSAVWVAGLVLSLASWLALLISCGLGVGCWMMTRQANWWVLPGLMLLIAASALGLWGITG